MLRAEENLVVAAGDFHADQLIAVFQTDRDDAAGPNIGISAQRRLFHDAFARGKHQESFFFSEIFDRQNIRDFLIRLKLQQVRN